MPLDVWATVLLDPERHLPARGHLLPRMPPENVQVTWTGTSGTELMASSIAFVRCLQVRDEPVLDYGVGWGRISRLLLKYVPVERLHGVDAWEESLEHASACGIPHPLRLVSRRVRPDELTDRYALVYAMSVFTHLGPEAFLGNLRVLVGSLKPSGRLVITVRPPEYWLMPGQSDPNADRVEETFARGIVHRPMPVADFGDTAVAPWWIEARLRESGLERLECDWNAVDPYQIIWSGFRAG